MKFLLAVAVLTLVGAHAHAASDIVVKNVLLWISAAAVC